MVSTKHRAKEPIRAAPRTTPQPQPPPPSTPTTDSPNGKKKKKKKGKGKATGEQLHEQDAFTDRDLGGSPPLDYEDEEEELDMDLNRHVADMANDLVDSATFVHMHSHSTNMNTTHAHASLNIQVPFQAGDPLHRLPTTAASATEAAQAELLATANELYRRMDADPAGGMGVASDEEYWASLPAHIRNFVRTTYSRFSPPGRCDNYRMVVKASKGGSGEIKKSG